jgi:hypothetical protein
VHQPGLELLARAGKAWHRFFVYAISRTHEHIPLFFVGLSWRATCCLAFAWVYFGTTSANQTLLQAEDLDALCVRMVDYAQKLEEERPSIPQQDELEITFEDHEEGYEGDCEEDCEEACEEYYEEDYEEDYESSRSWDGLAGPWREYWDFCVCYGLLKEQPVLSLHSLGLDSRVQATSCSPYAWIYFSEPYGFPGDPGQGGYDLRSVAMYAYWPDTCYSGKCMIANVSASKRASHA